MVHPAVLDEMAAKGIDGEVDAILQTVIAHALDPVVGQALGDAWHTLGEDVEDDVRPFSDDAPHLRAPLVCLFYECV